MMGNTCPKVTTIGELMEALKGGKTKHVSLPVKAGSGSLAQRIREGKAGRQVVPPRELSDFDDMLGQPRYGPDPHKAILYWNAEAYSLKRRNWQFLSVVWGRCNVPFAEIGERVWGDDFTNPSTIRSRAQL